VRTVVLAGSGTAFCAGMDLNEMQETAKSPNAQEMWREDAAAYRDLLETMLRLPKPIVATVGGPAVAGGAGLVLACDIVLAAPEAKFGLPEPRRGIVAGLVTPLLAFRLGAGRAAYLLMSAQTIAAEMAHQMGVYHELHPGEKLWPRAHQLAGEIAHCAPEAMLLTKRMLNETIGEALDTQLAAGAAVSATARTTDSAAEGLAAFLEKREPKFR
jgi:methylglutaconyl-CoA hydratase